MTSNPHVCGRSHQLPLAHKALLFINRLFDVYLLSNQIKEFFVVEYLKSKNLKSNVMLMQ